MFVLFVRLVTVFSIASAIYEDQVGKFDWWQEYVGCPKQIFMERSKGSKPPQIYLSTEADMVASVNSLTGQIVWRNQLEHSPGVSVSFSPAAKLMLSMTKNGEVVRAWDQDSGILVWETQISRITKSWNKSELVAMDGDVFICRDNYVTALSLNNGQLKWDANVESIKNWIGMIPGSQTLIVIGEVEGTTLSIVQLDVTNGALVKTQELIFRWFNREKCKLSGTFLWCSEDNDFYFADLSSDPVSVQHITLPNVVEIEAVSAYLAPDGRKFLAAVNSANKVTVYDAVNGKQLFEGTISENNLAPAKLISFTGTLKEFNFAIVLEDCRFFYFTGSSNKLTKGWIRHEALSSITSVEMVDLPLSEAQADIELEFSAEGGSIMQSFLQRLRSQIEQFRRSFVNAADLLISSTNLLPFRSKSFADWFDSFHLGRNTQKKIAALERDYFNLRKVIVAATLKGILYGIDSNDGTILWHMYMGKNIKPLCGSLGNEKIPLYIQRTTAHYHFSPQATIIAANKDDGHPILISFNPITGAVIEQKSLPSSIKRIEILPYVNPLKHIHHLIMVDDNKNIILYPEDIDGLETHTPLHFFTFDAACDLEGLVLNISRRQLSSTWKIKLDCSNEQNIVAVVPKPFHQKVHSAGRVLGNRSVLYKYANPNLVAFAVLDSAHSMLQIHLIDAVSGYIVYSAKQIKIAGPLHLVHCENWLAYSYWNEKGRRMEIGIVELYEGHEQTDALHSNSLAPTRMSHILATSQAYVFPQGVTALGVTETEQGLSTRSLLVAMPSGGIYSISKRLLDPRRPLEMTQELAEEMILPYRPDLPVAFEDFINYNQTVHNIRNFKTAASGLESTSLILAYGTDLFFTRLTPSGTFDILKDDFDHLLISVVLVGLVIGSLVCKKLGRNNSLKQAWQ